MDSGAPVRATSAKSGDSDHDADGTEGAAKLKLDTDALAYRIESVTKKLLEKEVQFMEGFSIKVMGVDANQKFAKY